jgi:hypothetical protein
MNVGQLIRVWTDVGARKPVPLLAKIVDRNENIFTIRYLSESDDKIWRYEEDTYEIDSDSVAEILKTDLEDDLGFQAFDDGFIKIETDDDYIPTDEDEDEDEESDIYDSTEEEDEEYDEDESSEPEEDDDEEENIDEE